MKQETRIIGKDVWWDHKLQRFRKKRINLTKVPLEYRCPNCGKILVKPDERYWNDAGFNLGWYGGVCKNCWLDGFGDYGEHGVFMKKQLEKDKEKLTKFKDERLQKYGEEPKYWLNPGFTVNPKWQEWNQKRISLDEDEKRRKNARFVKSEASLYLS